MVLSKFWEAVKLLLKVVQECLVLEVLKWSSVMVGFEIRKSHFLSILNLYELLMDFEVILGDLKLLIRFAIVIELRLINLLLAFGMFEVFEFLESLILEEKLFILEE